MRTYTNPEANGYLTEAKACGKIVKELDRLIEKYRKAVKARKQHAMQSLRRLWAIEASMRFRRRMAGSL